MKNFGLKPPKKDPRDLSLSKHRQIHKLGSIYPVNLAIEGLKRSKAESENQADTIECTGYTACGMRKRKYKIKFSPDEFCAAEARTDGKKVFTETSLRTQAKTMCGKNAHGILPASLAKFSWQVNGQVMATSPSTWDPALDKEAVKYKADAFFLCDGPNDTYDNIRLALQTHDMEAEGVTAGITWHPLEWNQLGVDGVLPMPKSENVTTGHCIHIYDWNEKGLIADAHFGPDWADGGVCYISREIANKYIFTDEGPYIFLDGVEVEQVKGEQWNLLAYLKDWLVQLSNFLSNTGPKPDPIVIPDQVIPPPVVNQPIIPMSKYDFSTPVAAEHSVRVICDEMGLTVPMKNELDATVHAESSYNTKAKNENKDGKGNLLSTDWGVAQFNDKLWIGAGKLFPDVDFVLNNPDKCIREMCSLFLEGHADYWVAHKSGAFRKYLKVA